MEGTKCLLLIEPHDDTRQLLARLLKDRGFHVVVARGANDALAMATCRDVDLVVVDTASPNMELPGFLRTLRWTCGEVPVIGTTTAIAADLSRVKAMPFHRVLLKPYGLDQLLDAVRAATQERCACA